MTTKLKEYLRKSHITHRGFASDVGISTSTMHALLNGKHLPNIRDAVAIEKRTRGYVRVQDWLDDKYAIKDKNEDQKQRPNEKIAKSPKLRV
jgi:DNA-binding XRE family transcriptional regulator